MICSKCGFYNPDGVSHCKRCGSAVKGGEWTCPNCETTNSEDVCIICGTSRTEAVPSKTEKVDSSPKWPAEDDRPVRPVAPVRPSVPPSYYRPPVTRPVDYRYEEPPERTSKALIAVLIASIILMLAVIGLTTSYIVNAEEEPVAVSVQETEYEMKKNNPYFCDTDYFVFRNYDYI